MGTQENKIVNRYKIYDWCYNQCLTGQLFDTYAKAETYLEQQIALNDFGCDLDDMDWEADEDLFYAAKEDYVILTDKQLQREAPNAYAAMAHIW